MAIAENGPKLSIERVVATMAPVLLLLRLISPCGRAGSGPGVPPGTHLLPSRSALFVVSGGFLFGRTWSVWCRAIYDRVSGRLPRFWLMDLATQAPGGFPWFCRRPLDSGLLALVDCLWLFGFRSPLAVGSVPFFLFVGPLTWFFGDLWLWLLKPPF